MVVNDLVNYVIEFSAQTAEKASAFSIRNLIYYDPYFSIAFRQISIL